MLLRDFALHLSLRVPEQLYTAHVGVREKGTKLTSMCCHLVGKCICVKWMFNTKTLECIIIITSLFKIFSSMQFASNINEVVLKMYRVVTCRQSYQCGLYNNGKTGIIQLKHHIIFSQQLGIMLQILNPCAQHNTQDMLCTQQVSFPVSQ